MAGKPSYTDEDLIARLRDFAKKIGHTPAASELNSDPDVPGKNTYTAHFGSWKKALEAAGLDLAYGRSGYIRPASRIPFEFYLEQKLAGRQLNDSERYLLDQIKMFARILKL